MRRNGFASNGSSPWSALTRLMVLITGGKNCRSAAAWVKRLAVKNLTLRVPIQERQMTRVYSAPPARPKKCWLKVYSERE
jgi:hypothetical protein